MLKTMKGIIHSFFMLIIKRPASFKVIWPEIDQVEGFLVSGQEEWLFKTARALPDGSKILEIGAFKGRSSVSLGYGCLHSRRHVFSIDLFGGVYKDVEDNQELKSKFSSDFFDEWKVNIDKNGLSEYVTPLAGDSAQIARIWKAPIQMLFIDGSHQYEDVLRDFNNFYPFVVPNGIVALHDVVSTWEGPLTAWNENIKQLLHYTGNITTLAYGRKPEK